MEITIHLPDNISPQLEKLRKKLAEDGKPSAGITEKFKLPQGISAAYSQGIFANSWYAQWRIEQDRIDAAAQKIMDFNNAVTYSEITFEEARAIVINLKAEMSAAQVRDQIARHFLGPLGHY